MFAWKNIPRIALWDAMGENRWERRELAGRCVYFAAACVHKVAPLNTVANHSKPKRF